MGTTPGGSNVVSDDAVAANFVVNTEGSDDDGLYTVPADQDHFSIFLYSSSKAGIFIMKPTATAESEV